ncbi:MAG: SIR2 family protein [Bacteroidaceae bacterium]|nr:SIR2 family protein [Bacteroidaceae bacterium]
MELQESIIHALDGNAVLFLGSGFSIGATKEDGTEFKTAAPLAHKLLAECGLSKDEYVDDLGQASEVFVNMRSEHELVDYMRKEYTAIDVSPAQEVIASVKWQRIYTTNYDNVIELASLKNKRVLQPAILSQRLADFKDKSNVCVHLNGRVEGLTIDKLGSEFKLTGRSYMDNEFRNSEWLELLKSDLLTARTIVYVGYSMQYDLDIRRLVYSLPEIVNKTILVMYEKEPQVSQILAKTCGTPYPIGSNEYAKLIVEERKTYVPSAVRLSVNLCFNKVEQVKTAPKLLDKDVFELFTQGSYDIAKLFFSTQTPTSFIYSIKRTQLKLVLQDIEDGCTNLLIHSDLGNGKTLFIETLSVLLAQKGYEVFRFYRNRATLDSEIERICQSHAKTVFVFEDYSGCFDSLKAFALHRTDQIVIVSERSYVNEANYDDLSNLLGDFENIDLNRLDSDEIAQLIKIFETYGLWSYLSAKGQYEKENFIINKCRANLRNVVLELLKSPDILGRFKRVFDAAHQREGFYDAVVFILLVHVMHLNIGLDDLADALDVVALNSPKFKKDPAVQELVNFEAGCIRPKSSLVSQTLILELFSTTTIIDVLINVAKHLNERRSEKVAKQMMRRLMTFTNLQQVLNQKDASYKYDLLRYYEALKVLPLCKNNPYFWLQYAIVKLSEYDYGMAKQFFEAAYSFAGAYEHFDTYKIDNHYARFVLENERINGSQATCMEAFRHAHNILMDSRHKLEVRYYPYRVARNYYPFYERFFAGMTDAEKKEFLVDCQEILQRLEWYQRESGTSGNRKDVVVAKDGIIQILKEQKVI